jgi:GT2 family glycosyltransferase
MMRRSAFLAAGGYEPRLFLGGEERLLALDLAAAGWRMAYVPAAVVHHAPSARREARVVRERLLLRNRLWCAWLRRPWTSALAETGHACSRAARDPRLAPALLDALRGAAWIVRHRRVVPEHVEAALARIATVPARRASAPRSPPARRGR